MTLLRPSDNRVESMDRPPAPGNMRSDSLVTVTCSSRSGTEESLPPWLVVRVRDDFGGLRRSRMKTCTSYWRTPSSITLISTRSTGSVSTLRAAALISWDLQPALNLLAGEPVDVAEEREKVWGLLGGEAIESKPALIADAEYDGDSARGEDDDSGYGPDSYYARAMGKAD